MGLPRPVAFSGYRLLTKAPALSSLPALLMAIIDRRGPASRDSEVPWVEGGRYFLCTRGNLRVCHFICLIAGLVSSEHPDASTHPLLSASSEDGGRMGGNAGVSARIRTSPCLPAGRDAVQLRMCPRCRRGDCGYVFPGHLEGLIRIRAMGCAA